DPRLFDVDAFALRRDIDRDGRPEGRDREDEGHPDERGRAHARRSCGWPRATRSPRSAAPKASSTYSGAEREHYGGLAAGMVESEQQIVTHDLASNGLTPESDAL